MKQIINQLPCNHNQIYPFLTKYFLHNNADLEELQGSTLYCQTIRKMEAMIKLKLNDCHLLTDIFLFFTWIKLNACGLKASVMHLGFYWVIKRKQGTKIDCHYRSWKELLSGVPQESIIRFWLFNIYLCDLFKYGIQK